MKCVYFLRFVVPVLLHKTDYILFVLNSELWNELLLTKSDMLFKNNINEHPLFNIFHCGLSFFKKKISYIILIVTDASCILYVINEIIR